MLVDFCTLAASYAAWNDACLADAVLWYASLDAREPCRAEVSAARLYDPRAARIKSALDQTDVVVLLRGLPTHEQYALCNSGIAPILGPACVSQTFREKLSARVRQDTRLSGTIRRHCENAVVEHAHEWAAELALSAATRAPCCLFLPNHATLANALLEALDTLHIVQLDLADGAAESADHAPSITSDAECYESEHPARFLHEDVPLAEEQAPCLAPDVATQAWGESARKRKRRKWRYAFFASARKS